MPEVGMLQKRKVHSLMHNQTMNQSHPVCEYLCRHWQILFPLLYQIIAKQTTLVPHYDYYINNNIAV